MTLYGYTCKAALIWHRLKSALIYRPLFQRFGKGSILHAPMILGHPEHMAIGDRVYIRGGTRLEAVPDGVNTPLLSIGDDTNIEQNVHIVCHCRIRIGARVSITPGVVIIDTVHPFEGLAPGAKIGARISTAPSHVEIGDGCFIGANAVIMPNVTIGEGAVIGAGAVVTTDIPARAVVAGNPAKVLRIYDLVSPDGVEPSAL